jgi:hypothetical protein
MRKEQVSSVKILDGITATGAGAFHQPFGNSRTFQAVGQTTAGAGAATVKVQVSNDNFNWLDLGTITLTLSTTASSDGFASEAAWRFVRGNATVISGTGASVTLWLGA